jgi:hypothetical protein
MFLFAKRYKSFADMLHSSKKVSISLGSRIFKLTHVLECGIIRFFVQMMSNVYLTYASWKETVCSCMRMELKDSLLV